MAARDGFLELNKKTMTTEEVNMIHSALTNLVKLAKESSAIPSIEINEQGENIELDFLFNTPSGGVLKQSITVDTESPFKWSQFQLELEELNEERFRIKRK